MDKISLIKDMIEKNRKDGNLWYLLGIEYNNENNINDAILAFSEALNYCDDELKSKISSELINLVSKDKGKIKLTNAEEIIDEKVVPFKMINGGKKTDTPPDKKVVKFHDVGGLEDLKETISMKIIKPFYNKGLFSKFNKKVGGGILLFGPPGCGKTYIAKATAGECSANFKSIQITDILNKYIGESEQNIHNIFSTARQQKPCVLFFDEIDTIGFNRSRLTSEHLRSVIDQLLTEIEGIDSSTDELLIIGATNMPWDVDPALKRPGRFDKMVFVPPPDTKAREVIFKLKLSDRPVDEIDYTLLAKKTALYSGADIENVVECATENVISEIMKTENERQIKMDDILYAIENTVPSTLEWLRTISNYVKYSNQSGLYNDVDKFLKKNKHFL